MTRIVNRDFRPQTHDRNVKGVERSPAERTRSHPAGQPGMDESRKGKEKSKR